MMNFWLFHCLKNVYIVHEQLWLGFEQGFDRIYTLRGQIKGIKKNIHGSRKNKIRHYIIFCCIKKVKTYIQFSNSNDFLGAPVS